MSRILPKLAIVICLPTLFGLRLEEDFSQHNEQIQHRLYLIANTADIKDDSEFHVRLGELLAANPERFSLIVVGDLIATGITKKTLASDSIRIRKLLGAASELKHGDVIIIPGDRDWDDSGERGWKSVQWLEELVKSFKLENVKWAIKKGCPGPQEIELNENTMLVAINTQWWNHHYDKPGPPDAICKIASDNDFMEELEDIIDENAGKNIMIAGHFPVFSLGEYGGHMPVEKHLFPLTDVAEGLYIPLPVIGSFYATYRENVGTSKDIVNIHYESFRKQLENRITDRSSLIYLSGHEQNLQIIKKEENYFINSGSPTEAASAASNSSEIFSESLPGLIEIDYYRSGRVVARVHQYTESDGFRLYSQFDLFESACTENAGVTSVNTSFVPCEDGTEVPQEMSGIYNAPAVTVAGEEYAAGAFHRFFFGNHYRDTWTARVAVPYLNLDTTFGGLTPFKKGGGRQTTSLKLKAANGLRYVFRSVNKDPVKAIDHEFRETIITAIVRDQTSTQHPYGALVAEVMLNELPVLHAHPKLYVIPDDEKLGAFQEEYGNLLGLLEENPTSPGKGELAFGGADEIVRSNKLFRRLYEDHDNRVDAKNFAVARAFDVLVGDWGKHEDNWKWAGYRHGRGRMYRPIPRDRDHVFSRWDGVFPWLADREWAKSSGEDFDYEISGLRSLMWQARHLDRFIASRLSREDWLEAANLVQEKITDDVIERATRNMPEEVYDLSGREIERKLKKRISDLHTYIVKYYEMLAEEVDVVGSNKPEYFDVTRNPDGTVKVEVSNVRKKEDPGKGDELFYARTFYPDETDEIRLFGLGGKDVFNIQGRSDESILIRIVGGPGGDIIIDGSSVSTAEKKTLIYERGKNGKIEEGTGGRIVRSASESAYEYNRTAFTYDTYFPRPYILYDADDGFLISAGVEFTTQAYGKEAYSTKHNLRTSASTRGSLSFDYAVRFHHVLGETDILLEGSYADPVNFTYFYGLGNETVKDRDLFNRNFYRTRYNSKQLTASVIHDFWKRSSFSLALHYENNEAQIDKATTIFGQQDFLGSGKINLVEGVAGLDLDFRDRTGLPSSGTRLFISYNNGVITNNKGSNYGQTLASAEGFATVHLLMPVTLGIRGGGGTSYGDIPFYKQFALGQNTFLRGFRTNRFTGHAMVFLDSELRVQLLEFYTSVVPVRFGIKGFFNTGRIIQRGETSNKWHNGYGFGIFLIPLRERFALNVTAGFSKEESFLIQLSIGSSFN